MTRTTLSAIRDRRLPPIPWTEGDNIPWQDPGFSQRMLVEHLSQAHDLASRRSSSIEAQVSCVAERLRGLDHASVLDLACGPGLYLHRLARQGHRGYGIGFSPAAIDYARRIVAQEQLDCRFEYADLRHADFGEGFDMVLLIYARSTSSNASTRAISCIGPTRRSSPAARCCSSRKHPRPSAAPRRQRRVGRQPSTASSRTRPTSCCTSAPGTRRHARPPNGGS